MPKHRQPAFRRKIMAYTCRFCKKEMTLKESELHFYVCDKVPQEIFNGRKIDSNRQSFQNALGR